MTTPICTIDATGIHRPTLATVLAWTIAQFLGVYPEANLDSSTKDGEWVGIIASAIDDTNASLVQAYNAASPATAQGVGLSSVVKINGIQRLVPSYSTAPMLVVGQAGRTIIAGVVGDEAGNSWTLPTPLTFPLSGQISTTATCQTLGAIDAPINSINQIKNTQPGWQTATNIAPPTLGAPVELDPALKNRQSVSTMNSSTAIATGLHGALLTIAGVLRAAVYNNEGDLPNADDIPGHCLAAVVDGGDATAIATMIKAKKGGCATYGSTLISLTDTFGIQSKVSFFPVVKPPITVAVQINQLLTFTTDVISLIQTSVANYINARNIGAAIQYNRLYGAAYLYGQPQGQTYEIMSLGVARDGNTPTSADVLMAFFEAAYCLPENVIVEVLN